MASTGNVGSLVRRNSENVSLIALIDVGRPVYYEGYHCLGLGLEFYEEGKALRGLKRTK